MSDDLKPELDGLRAVKMSTSLVEVAGSVRLVSKGLHDEVTR